MSVALRWTTPGDWAPAALADPIGLLVDHAHCELGAASTAQTLIARHPAEVRLVDPLAALAAEELRHFRRVHRLIGALGGELRPIQSNPYAAALVRAVDRSAPTALGDRLLVSALIEARSLERFHLLATHLADHQLARLYADLVPSESRHHTLFLDCAREFFGARRADARFAELRAREAEIVAALPFAVRVHSGVG